MTFEHYIRSGQKMLRLGYTSGTCAALAAAGASELLLSGKVPDCLSVMTSYGLEVAVEPAEWGSDEDSAWCAVIKDGGDDVDITHGLKIYARAESRREKGVSIEGGEGIGRVTKPGLDQPVGNAAINSTPRKMIKESVEKIMKKNGYNGGINITVSAPQGEEIAKKTFNPMLGIEGGISILGTSGIVVPMSNQALIDTIEIEIKQAAEKSSRVILTPGNYGNDYIKRIDAAGGKIPVITISNFLGEAIDIAVTNGIREILVISHIGKIVKAAAGIMMTHSKYADGRKEIFCAHSAIAGAGACICADIMAAATTDRCIEIIDEAGFREKVMKTIMKSIGDNIQRRAGEDIITAAIAFSNVYGEVGRTEEAGDMIIRWEKENTTV